MIPDTLKTAVFKSLPKSGIEGKMIQIEFADAARVSKLLEDYDIVVTISFFGETKASWSPSNNLLKKTSNDDNTVTYLIGERRQCTISLNVHVKKIQGTVQAGGPELAAYLSLLDEWYLKDLKIVEGIDQIIGRSSESDLSFLEDGSTRIHVDVYIAYRKGYTETVESIETEEITTTLS